MEKSHIYSGYFVLRLKSYIVMLFFAEDYFEFLRGSILDIFSLFSENGPTFFYEILYRCFCYYSENHKKYYGVMIYCLYLEKPFLCILGHFLVYFPPCLVKPKTRLRPSWYYSDCSNAKNCYFISLCLWLGHFQVVLVILEHAPL